MQKSFDFGVDNLIHRAYNGVVPIEMGHGRWAEPNKKMEVEQMSTRFEIVATSHELVIVDGKTAIRVELQYGKAGEPTELVIAELYVKDGAWAYTRSQVRIPCTTANAKHVLDAVKTMHDASKKVTKTETTSTTTIEKAIAKMSDAEKSALLAALVKTEKPATTDAEIVLDATLTKTRKGGKK